MNSCPSCQRNLAATLSVCPSCGTMLNDSVREELALKISPLARAAGTESVKTAAAERLSAPAAAVVAPALIEPVAPAPVVAKPEPVAEPLPTIAAKTEKPSAPVSAPAPRMITAELTSKPTSPTLVEFYNKNASLPEWRLQLQNSVRMRTERGSRPAAVATQTVQTPAPKPPRAAALATKGATALQPEYAEKPAEQEEPAYAGNPKLAAALRRIEASRRQYLAEKAPPVAETPQPKTFPYVVTSKAPEAPARRAETEPVSTFTVKPRFQVADAAAPKAEKFDTNKLPPLPVQTRIESSVQPAVSAPQTIAEPIIEARFEAASEKKTFLNCEVIEEIDLFEDVADAAAQDAADEMEGDDRAPVALRFNAGLFDLIIGAFSSALLLSPFMLAGSKMFTFEGALAFLATLSIVMFIYLTASIGLMGRTFGMRMFSLEVVDIDENAYPSLHQAAVSSSVYLLSLAFGGVGFLTLFLNDEKRAAHDLLSGTIVVKEY